MDIQALGIFGILVAISGALVGWRFVVNPTEDEVRILGRKRTPLAFVSATLVVLGVAAFVVWVRTV